MDYQKAYLELQEEFQRFAYVVSHDLNAPLRHVREFSKLLLADMPELSENQKLLSEYIQKSVYDSEQLLGNLLTYSRINTQQEEKCLIKMDDLLNDRLKKMQMSIEHSGATVHYEPSEYEVYGDYAQLSMLIDQLLDNALKFGSDQRRLHVEIGLEEKNSAFVVWFKDNGQGIKPQYTKRIFDLFVQIDKQVEGTGFGLALVKKIIDRHQGQVSVDSQPGQGSTFVLSFPKPGESC